MNYRGGLNIPSQVIQPWSDVLMRFELPERLVQELQQAGQSALEMHGRTNNDMDYSSKLVGQLETEIGLDIENLNKNILNIDVLYDCINTYIQKCEEQLLNDDEMMHYRNRIKIDMIWINIQKENEYIPMHRHNNCNLSAVMYLGMPNQLPSKKDWMETDGMIEFIGGMNTWGESGLTKCFFVELPRVGDFYIFPSHMGHMVYPFRGKGHRISVSMNISYTKSQE